MSVPALNKRTLIWNTTDNPDDLVPAEDWLINPSFSNEEFARSINAKYWRIENDVIVTPTEAEYQAIVRAEDQRTAWLQIQEERERQQSGGAKVGDYWFHSDPGSRIQFVSLMLIGENMPTIMWKTMSGEFVQMTPLLAQQIFGAIVQKDIDVFGAAEQHRHAMMQLDNPYDYDFSGGWPPSYEPTPTQTT